MNRLQHETSPYLLQHAHNPVDWYAWKPEAFEKAKKEDKAILVSIGYSTCHWCHVMERESFEDKEVADFMNDHFVCIKVDREERPDVDQIYMEACQVLTGSGGWPLNCFLTPDGRPFYAGTYYPPMPMHKRPSWLQVLMNLSHAFNEKRETVEEQANRLTDIIKNSGRNFTEKKLRIVREEESPFSKGFLDKIYHGLQRTIDRRNGGFGSAPKFPGTMSLQYLLAYHYYNGDNDSLAHVELSLDKMIRGGIYDQLGGGFARYATDVAWLVPHFEKMLYDNALLVNLLSEAYMVTQKPLYKEAVEETLGWVAREMTSEEGGFYSALDADSEGVEGKFYVWSKAEVDRLLGEESELFCKFYGVSENGNWEHKNILWRKWSFSEFAKVERIVEGALRRKLADSRAILFAAREKRIRPGLDDKILLDWNAMMCSAYVRAYSAFGEEVYKQVAIKNVNFLIEKFSTGEGANLFHTYKEGRAQYEAFLNDYAYLIDALINVYEVTFDASYLLKAGEYLELVLDEFLDTDEKLFYFTSVRQTDLPLRRKDLFDSAIPSGNATMVHNLHRLGILLGKENLRSLATHMLLTMKDAVGKYPSSFSRWATSMMSEVHSMPEIAIVGKDAEVKAVELMKKFIPQKALMASQKEDGRFPLLSAKRENGEAHIYLCKDYSCRQPVKTVAEFEQLIRQH